MNVYYSRRSAAKWLARHANPLNHKIKINTAYLKRLEQECWLLPAKSGIFGKRYCFSFYMQMYLRGLI